MTLKTAEKTSRTIAGHSITLQPGCRYRADRQFIKCGRTIYPVSIRVLQDGDSFAPFAEPVFVVDGLTYDAANELLAAFNDGETSFDGRVWE